MGHLGELRLHRIDGWMDESPWASVRVQILIPGGLGRGLRFSVFSPRAPGDAAASGRGTVS